LLGWQGKPYIRFALSGSADEAMSNEGNVRRKLPSGLSTPIRRAPMPTPSSRSSDHSRGAALVFVVIMMVVVGTVAFVAMAASTASSRLSSWRVERGVLRGYAEHGVANSYYQLWNEYLHSKGGTAGNYNDYATWLASTYGLASGGSLALLNETTSDRTSVAATVSRRDVPASYASFLTVTSTATAVDGSSATITTIFKVGGKPYQGFGYGLLTNSVDCMMCHVGLSNVDLAYNKSAANYGTYPATRVGITGETIFRSDVSAMLGGQLLTRGPVLNESGQLLTTLPTGISSLAISSTNGDISQSSTGSTSTVTGLTAATAGSGGALPSYASFYENYPTDPSQETAGQLPTNFPSPFNGMDYVTWAAASATGSLSGGVVYQTNSYTSTTLPTLGNTTSVNGYTTGSSVVLVGTAAAPIVLNGTVGFGGDVFIQGYVKGSGEIAAQGNLYVLGDLKYADGTDASGQRTYGVAQDGRTNSIALTAGGNVLVGNYIATGSGTVMGPSDATLLNKEIGTFNRDEWTKTQPYLPGVSGAMVANAKYDPSYVPSYYTFNPGDPVYVEAPVPGGKGITYRDVYWDPSTSTWQGKTSAHNSLANDDPITPPSNAALLPLNSTAMSNSTFNALAENVDKARTSGTTLEIDALLYSSNLIFVLARNNTTSKGYVNLNGSIVAKNTAILSGASSPGAVMINFDKRNAAQIQIVDTSQVAPYTLIYMEN
jgi:Tfp pilus assembly protein PilX